MSEEDSFFKIIHVHQTAAVAMGSDRDHQTCLQTEKRMSGKSVVEGKGKTERLAVIHSHIQITSDSRETG